MSYRILFIVFLLGACKQKDAVKPIDYNGPLGETEEVTVLYTEKNHIKVRLQAKKILEFKNGDREFPAGLYLEFYNDAGVLTSTLKANNAYYFNETKKWRGREKVEVKNIEKQQQLNTEELFWEPATKKIFTDKFVTIKLETEVIYGTGLDAIEDMSKYTIRNIEGEFDIKD